MIKSKAALRTLVWIPILMIFKLFINYEFAFNIHDTYYVLASGDLFLGLVYLHGATGLSYHLIKQMVKNEELTRLHIWFAWFGLISLLLFVTLLDVFELNPILIKDKGLLNIYAKIQIGILAVIGLYTIALISFFTNLIWSLVQRVK